MQTEITVEVKILVEFNKPPSGLDIRLLAEAAKERLLRAALSNQDGPVGAISARINPSEDWTPVGTEGNTFRLKRVTGDTSYWQD